MTHRTRWIASYSLLACSLIPIGCVAGRQTESGGANPPMMTMAPVLDAKTSPALQQLEQGSRASADAIRAIDIARDVSLNNLENAETTAFKGSRALLQEGGKVYTQLNLTQGAMEATNAPTDVGIQGNGFFAVKTLAQLGGTGYTRNGNFLVNRRGELFLGMGEGSTLVPPITMPPTATNINIGLDGTVSYVMAGTNIKATAGQLKLALFPNPQGLKLLGGSIYAPTDESGPPIHMLPGTNGAGHILSGYLERSNVDKDYEMIRIQHLNKWRAQLLQALGLHT